MNNKTIPFLKISGSHREIGRQIGEAMRTEVAHSVNNARKLLTDAYDTLQLDWDGALIQARKYLPFAEERYPQYVEELRGISEGAGVNFYDLVMVNSMEAVTTDALHLTKCTSFAVNQDRTANGKVLIAHNEDWVPEDEGDIYVIQARPDHEAPFLAMSYGGLLPNIGLNAHGIAQCCDSVYPTDSRIGIPRVIASRAVLAAQTPGDAIRRTLVSKRAAGYNHLIVHESGELYSVEVSAKRFAILYGENGQIVHTNHFLDKDMRAIESDSEELIATRVRYFRALRLLNATEQHTIKTLQQIQKDHINYPDSICNHAEDGDPLDREKTITALTIDLTSRQIHAAWGNPCTSSFCTFQLDA
ncbi:MAG TPA: C45 family autoproteolytic acyltransferase/hydrolase [Bellilinea sp.]|jgi:isopenicillin-N N-acyltransferase-like protein|nr:C45 family autoproteolytic acyltransferase/hydrolase [Bellilinea sp.]